MTELNDLMLYDANHIVMWFVAFVNNISYFI